MRSLLLSPHADDEALFAAHVIQRHRPIVAICFGSGGDYGSTETRFLESGRACELLGAAAVLQRPSELPLVDYLRSLDALYAPDIVWAPHEICSHVEHIATNNAAAVVFGDRMRRFHTYKLDFQGAPMKTRAAKLLINATPAEVLVKMKALACYRTQLLHPRAYRFFEWDLFEYAEQP